MAAINHPADIEDAEGRDAAFGARRPTLTLDVGLYEEFLADQNLGDDQKRALLDALWAIVVGFVDLGFAVEPADKSAASDGEFALAGIALIDSGDPTPTDHFEKAAAHTTQPGH